MTRLKNTNAAKPPSFGGKKKSRPQKPKHTPLPSVVQEIHRDSQDILGASYLDLIPPYTKARL